MNLEESSKKNATSETYLKKAKAFIYSQLESLLEQTLNKVKQKNNIAEEKLDKLVSNLKDVDKALTHLEGNIEANLKNNLTQKKDQIKNVLVKTLNEQLESIKTLINIRNFEQVSIQIEKIDNIINILDNYCPPEIESHKNNLVIASEKELNAVKANYSKVQQKVDVYEFTKLKPLHLFKQLSNDKYQNLRLLLENNIRETYQNKVDQLKKSNDQSQQEKTKELDKIEKTVKYLPLSIIDEVKDIIQTFREHLTDEYNKKEEMLEELVRGHQYDSILSHLKRDDSIDPKLLQKLKEFIRKKMSDFHENIRKQIMANNTKDALHSILPLFEFKQKFVFKFSAEIQIEYPQIQATFAALMDKVQGILVKAFVNTEVSSLQEISEGNLNDSNDSIKSATSIFQLFQKNGTPNKQDQQKDQTSQKSLDSYEAFQILFLYLHLKTQKESKDAFQEMFQQIEKPVSNVLKKINDVVKKEQDLFTKSLSHMHISSIKNILYTMKNWSALFSIMTEESDRTIFENADVEHLYSTINKYPYKQMLIELKNKVVELKANITTQLQEKWLKLKKEMDDFYQKINSNLNEIKNIDRLKEYQIEINFSQIKKECLQSIDTRINYFVSLQEEILKKGKLAKEDCLNLGHSLNNLASISQYINYERVSVENSKKQLETKLQQYIEEVFASAREDTQPEALSQNLIQLKLLCDNIIPYKEQINEKIEEILKQQTKKNKKIIVKLGILLDSNPIGKILISEHKTFSGVQNQLFNSKAQRHTIDIVLDSLKGDQMDKEVLRSRYSEFDKEYKDIIKWYINPNNYKNLGGLISDTKKKSGGFTQYGSIKWDQQVLDSISVIAAHIFALYTLQNASQYFDSSESGSTDYLFTPHPAQVISIFRLLGLGYQKKGFAEKLAKLSWNDQNQTLQNNLIQIGTGEGKSVTLAVASSILALSGFEVYCACYSSYLSKRDFKAFSQLFDALSVTQKIHYGTFNEVCERLLNNRFNIRQKVQEFISSGTLSETKESKTDACLKVLLIDEVDVFLNKEFYGNIYSPSLVLRDSAIKTFADFLWALRTSPKIDLYQIQSSKEYKAVTSKYRGWDDLILELTKEMILCLQNFEGHTYEVNEKENKIGYQLLDSITYNAVQSYNTLFAYYLECTQKKTIAEISLEENVFLSVRCGEFSYAAIPQDFSKIMGVTGTLDTLTNIESDIIEQQYGMRKCTYIPSVFGKNNLKFNENDVYVENQDDYYNVIRREIYNKLNPYPSNGIQRAVLVFFESAKKLLEFFNSPAYDLQDMTNYLTEQANADEKDTLIKNATNVGQITFLTRSFGRGTDFIVRDEVILNNGGIHVIQTFVSEELSEEVQIKGRTARQGNQGSYSMILLDQSLELFGITIQEIADNKGKLIKLLSDKRNQYQLQQQLNNKEFIQQVQKKHEKSKKFLRDLQSSNIKEIKNYLKELNKGPQIQLDQTRTLCLIDATGSMGTLLSKVKTTVHTMFERASQTLTDGGYNPDSFLLKFAVYRNYPQKESEILVASGWESSPLNLREFIQHISAYGGDGPGEAVEIGFQFALLELQELKEKGQNIDQILVIGDAPSNTAQETISHRKSYHGGEAYWSKTKFNKPGNIQQLVTSLRGQNIITNAFYLTDYAKQSFIQIATWGGGQSQFLDINSNKGSEDLTNLVTVEILRKVGNQGGSIENGEKLVQAYKSKYLSYTS